MLSDQEKADLADEARRVEEVEVITKAEREAGVGPEGEQAEKPQLSTGQLITMLSRKGFDIFCPAWEVTDEECAMWGEATGDVVDTYFPDLDLGPIPTFLVITAAVFGPRLGQPRKVEAPKKDDKKKDDKKTPAV